MPTDRPTRRGHESSADAGSRVRLQRVMADAGVAARRACEDLIRGGQVEGNGELVTDLPVFVDPSEDKITIDGRPLPRPERHIYVMLHKPRRTLTTAKDEDDLAGGGDGGSGRRTVLDLVDHPARARLFPVGRLDYDTTGLVLLTNDGELANRLTHPRYEVHKTYRAVVKRRMDEEAVEALRNGLYLADRREGRTTGASRTAGVDLEIVRYLGQNTVLDITLREGRNRQVRRMLAQVGCPVKKLTRIKMGPLSLKGVGLGAWRELTAKEVRSLRKAAKGKPPASRADR